MGTGGLPRRRLILAAAIVPWSRPPVGRSRLYAWRRTAESAQGRHRLSQRSRSPLREARPWAEAVAVKDGIITTSGRDKGARRWIGNETEVIDLHPACDARHGGRPRPRARIRRLRHGLRGRHDRVRARQAEGLPPTADQLGLLKTNFRLTASSIYIQSLLPPGTRLTRYVLDRSAPIRPTTPSARARPARSSCGTPVATNSPRTAKRSSTPASTRTPPTRPTGSSDGTQTGAQRALRDFNAAWGPNPPAPPDSTYLSRSRTWPRRAARASPPTCGRTAAWAISRSGSGSPTRAC